MRAYANLLAHIEHRTRRAVRQLSPAYMLSEWDQKAVDLYPVTAREFFAKRIHSLFRRSRFDITPTVSHAMDVNVYADERLAAGYAEHEVSAFRADAFKGEQDIGVARQ